jgi:hypothetical protein
VLQITPAERAALQLLGEGKSISHAAALLELGECDLNDMLAALLARMQIRTRLEAIDEAFRRGLINVELACQIARAPS